MIVMDALLAIGATWMVSQVATGIWSAPDPALTITMITQAA